MSTRAALLMCALFLSQTACLDLLDRDTPDPPDTAEAKPVETLPTPPPLAKPIPAPREHRTVKDLPTPPDPVEANEERDPEPPRVTKRSKPSKEKTPDKPRVNADPELHIKRLVVSQGVSNREPVGAASTFTAGAQKRIFAFLEVANPNGEASEVVVTFHRQGGKSRGGVRVRVGDSARWRTWATTRHATVPGTWFATVHGADGKVLARTTFTVVGDAPADTKPVPAT